MDKKETQKELCKNNFKNGECLDKCQFSAKWVELINRLEKFKSVKF